MTETHPSKDKRQRRSSWFAAPLLWIAIAALSLVVAANWHGLLSSAAQGQQSGSSAAPSVAPLASAGETSVPSASSVFIQPTYLVAEHVQAF
jgi:hypothetical protein